MDFYPAPRSDDVVQSFEGRERFKYLDRQQLKKILVWITRIRMLAYLWILGSVVSAMAVVALLPVSGQMRPALVSLALIAAVQALAIIAIFTRRRWVQGIAILLCVLMLTHVPIGTLVGVMGITAFVKGSQYYFAEPPWSAAELKAEIAQRKRQGID